MKIKDKLKECTLEAVISTMEFTYSFEASAAHIILH